MEQNPKVNLAARHMLTFFGGLLTYSGLSADDLTNLVNLATAFVGALITFVGFAWSIWAKLAASREAKQIAAEVAVAGVSITQEVAAAEIKKS